MQRYCSPLLGLHHVSEQNRCIGSDIYQYCGACDVHLNTVISLSGVVLPPAAHVITDITGQTDLVLVISNGDAHSMVNCSNRQMIVDVLRGKVWGDGNVLLFPRF